jgi:hypothetical protein
MQLAPFPFQIIDWSAIEKEEKKGLTGKATWQVVQMGKVRIRRLEYSSDYSADHWCSKGHVIHCLEGDMHTELEDGRIMHLAAGQTYIVGDDSEAHRSRTEKGCVLFVVD